MKRVVRWILVLIFILWFGVFLVACTVIINSSIDKEEEVNGSTSFELAI